MSSAIPIFGWTKCDFLNYDCLPPQKARIVDLHLLRKTKRKRTAKKTKRMARAAERPETTTTSMLLKLWWVSFVLCGFSNVQVDYWGVEIGAQQEIQSSTHRRLWTHLMWLTWSVLCFMGLFNFYKSSSSTSNKTDSWPLMWSNFSDGLMQTKFEHVLWVWRVHNVHVLLWTASVETLISSVCCEGSRWWRRRLGRGDHGGGTEAADGGNQRPRQEPDAERWSGETPGGAGQSVLQLRQSEQLQTDDGWMSSAFVGRFCLDLITS